MARRWAGGGADTRRPDLEAFGLVLEYVEDEDVEVWPDNLETVEAFFACRTQWVVGDMSGHWRGLRYADVAATLDMLAVADKRDVFEGIRVMESVAIEVFNAAAGEKK